MKTYHRPTLARLGCAVQNTLGLVLGMEHDFSGRYRKRVPE